MTQVAANEVLTYLKLNLLSLLPGRESIVREYEVDGLHPQVLLPLHDLTGEPYYQLAMFVETRIAAHQFSSTRQRIQFCLTQLTAVAPMQYAALQLTMNLRDRDIYNRFDSMQYRVEKVISEGSDKEASLTGFRIFWRFLTVFAAGMEQTEAWWTLDYLPPTKTDVDDYMRPLRHMMNITPA